MSAKQHRAARQKLAAIRARVEKNVPALIDELRQINMRLGAIEVAFRAERTILRRELESLAAPDSVAPLEDWQARAAEVAIRGALERIEQTTTAGIAGMWLYVDGDDGPTLRRWTAADFHSETLKNCGLER